MSSLDTTIRRAMIAVVTIVAAASATLSYAGLAALGHDAGLGALSPLLPIAVDGTVLAGMLGVLHASVARTSTAYSWGLVLLGLGVSVWGNASTATTPSDRVVHAIAPIALALSLEALTASLRRRVVGEHFEAQRLAAAATHAERAASRPANPARPRTAPKRPTTAGSKARVTATPERKDAIRQMLADPQISKAEVVRQSGLARSTAYAVIKELEEAA